MLHPDRVRSGRFGCEVLYDLSHFDTKFVRMICGYRVAMVGGSFSPSTFLVLNNSHLSPGIVLILQPVGAYTLQRNSSSGATLTGKMIH